MEKGRGKASVPRDADITQLQTEPAKASREIEPAGTRSRETSSLTVSFAEESVCFPFKSSGISNFFKSLGLKISPVDSIA